MTEYLAATRDGSVFPISPDGRLIPKYHASEVTERPLRQGSLEAVCSGAALAEFTAQKLPEVAERMRCRRSACVKAWATVTS